MPNPAGDTHIICVGKGSPSTGHNDIRKFIRIKVRMKKD